MGVPGADDIMLNYQSTSFHDALYVRKVLGKHAAPEFEAWLAATGISDIRGELSFEPARLMPALPLLEAER
jgi:ethanolamine ammonia-lyase large subunit